MSISSSSSQHSMTSTPSVDLSTYQDDLENVLAWLLEAEEIVEKQEPIGSDIKKVKDQFNQHEVSYKNRISQLICSTFRLGHDW